MLNLTTTASELSDSESLTASCPTPPSLVISDHSLVKGTPQHIREWLMSSQEGSPASHSVKPESDLEPMTPAICGRPQSNASAWYDRDTHCWRTFQSCFLVDILEPFSVTWPRQGMTQDGLFFPLAPLAHHIHESACSFWPTPRAHGSCNAGGSNSRKTAIAKGTYVSGSINPNLYEWLMGWPIEWTGLKPLAMDKFQQWSEQHGNC